jgi:hypothetical protein
MALPACAATPVEPATFFTRTTPWILYLFLANGNVVTSEIETLEQCLRHGHTLIRLDPARFTVKEPICLPYQDPDRHP